MRRSQLGQWETRTHTARDSEILLRIRRVTAVILALDGLENRLHLLGLALPLLITHLGLAAEELLVRLAVATAQAVPKSGELAVVVVEVQMVHGVAGSTVHDRAIGNVLAIVNEDSPEVDKAEQEDVGHLLERENERENVVRHTLRPAVQGVESVRSVRAGHDPLMVRLVQGSVHARVVQASVDPVDEEIGEEDEEGELQDTVEGEGLFGGGIVEFGVSADFQDEEWGCQEGHWGHRAHGLFDFHGDLVLEEFGVFVGGFVPDEDVR